METKIGLDIAKAAELLQRGSCVAIPTETVYGLAANGLSERAVAKIFKTKNRPTFDPLILHISKIESIRRLTADFPEKARILAENFWPGPLTLILQKSKSVPDLVSAGLPTVGIRMPRHDTTLNLLNLLDFPLAAPSANPFGYISPTSAMHVKNQLGGKIPYILDGGKCHVGLESTIVRVTNGEIKILRMGGISIEAIEKAVGTVEVQDQSSSHPTAPGMLISHYAPRKRLIVGNISELMKVYRNETIAVIGFKSTHGAEGEILSSKGELAEAAQNLYAALRKLDAGECTLIIAEKVPDIGIGKAINDRLRRAASTAVN